ncbi:MAG: type I restriction endonuclease subunit R, partial [Eubacterium sp.]
FSLNTTNNDTQLDTNKGLFEAMTTYNNTFGTSFGMDDVSGYTQDVTSRLNRTASDKNYLDLVIVVDQLLTGFDAPELNTLYVDRTLKGAGLIQAYSRTNRIANMQDKPWGRIVNYRWPTQNEILMNRALATYANDDSAKLSDEERKQKNTEEGIIAESFEKVFDMVKKLVDKIRDMTSHFTKLPPSEKQKEYMLDLMRKYNSGMAKLKQYDPETVDGETLGFDYEKPDDLTAALGMEPDEEITLTTVLSNELKKELAKSKNVTFEQISLEMIHVKDVKVDYDYLTQLLEDLLNQIHNEEKEAATETKEKIHQFAGGLENRNYAAKIISAADAIAKGQYEVKAYPARLDGSETVIQEANAVTLDRIFQDFRIKWGIIDVVTSAEMRELFSHHRYGQQDLDDTGKIRTIIAKASTDYKTLAHDEGVQGLTKIKYRNGLRDAIYALADELVEG